MMSARGPALIVLFVASLLIVPMICFGSYYETEGYVKFYGEEGMEQSVGAGDNLGHAMVVGDIDNDGKDDLVVAAGPDPAAATPVRVYRLDGGAPELLFSLDAFDGAVTHGSSVAAGLF